MKKPSLPSDGKGGQEKNKKRPNTMKKIADMACKKKWGILY
jgi:hypothetical protein